MRYSTEPRFIWLFVICKKFGDKYDKKLMDTATKTAEATEDLIGNKIGDKITSIGKPKEKEKTKETEEIYISPEKRQQIIDDLINAKIRFKQF